MQVVNELVLEDSSLQRARETLHKLDGRRSKVISRHETGNVSASLESTVTLRNEFAHLNLDIEKARLPIPELLNHPPEQLMKTIVEQQVSIQQQSQVLAKQRKDVDEFQNNNANDSSQATAKRKRPRVGAFAKVMVDKVSEVREQVQAVIKHVTVLLLEATKQEQLCTSWTGSIMTGFLRMRRDCPKGRMPASAGLEEQKCLRISLPSCSHKRS